MLSSAPGRRNRRAARCRRISTYVEWREGARQREAAGVVPVAKTGRDGGHGGGTSRVLSGLGRLLLAGRMLLAVFFLGLIWGLGLFALRFVGRLWELTTSLWERSEDEMLVEILHLVDAALIASLVVIVALSSYDSLVDRLQHEADRKELRWVSRTDHVNMKIKVATTMVAISGIHLLQEFLATDGTNGAALGWRVGIHLVFLLGAVLLAVLDRLDKTEGQISRNEVP